jgi:hypothetical protein
MKFPTIKIWLLILGLFCIALLGDQTNLLTLDRLTGGECTIGVFSGSVTTDGRPIIWKNRDIYNPDQRYIYYRSYHRNGIATFPFTGDCFRNDTTRIYMGVNARGFAIMNSDSYNLHDTVGIGIDDGTIMRVALEICATISDFSRLLDSTNTIGRQDCWNFGCLDSTGAVAMFECANYTYWKYEPGNSDTPIPGIILRANYSIVKPNTSNGYDRYKRASDLTLERLGSRPIDVAFVLQSLARDMGSVYDIPYPLPYCRSQANGPPGYIFNLGCTIANRSTTSAVVIRGVTANESPLYTTLFAILGPPVLSPAFPLWVGAESVPYYLSMQSGAPVYNICVNRMSRLYDNTRAPYHLNSHALVNDDSGGAYTYIIPLENWGISQTDLMLGTWGDLPPAPSDMEQQQFRIAKEIFDGFESESVGPGGGLQSDTPGLPKDLSFYCYPNPFNDNVRLVFAGADSHFETKFRIYNLNGQLVTEIPGTKMESGYVYWHGRDDTGQSLSSGVYLCCLVNGASNITGKILYLK